MGSREQKIEELKQKWYDPVYIWDEGPNEEDPDHTHPFDTHLLILNGEIEVRMNGKSTILRSGDEIEIPRDQVHYGKAGTSGCRYIVAEKH